jgi:ABC-2 type transport system ATP-binding protein
MELIANRMVVINKGRVVVEGDVRELTMQGSQRMVLVTNNPQKSFTLLTESFPDTAFTINRLNEIQAVVEPSQVEAINRLLVQHEIGVRQLHVMNSLEDYFLNIT